MSTAEYPIYVNTINYLEANGFQIVCGCPPTGTDCRYKKCLFPKKNRTDKGSRDEIDVIAFKAGTILFIECKPLSQDSRSKINYSGENDEQKLVRISKSFSLTEFTEIFKNNYKLDLPITNLNVATSSQISKNIKLALSVPTIDIAQKQIVVSEQESLKIFKELFPDFTVGAI